MKSAASFYENISQELGRIKDAGLYKKERLITTPQGSVIGTDSSSDVVNLCANNYLGLSSHPEIIDAAREALTTRGYGLSSVRFICGTQDIHKELENRLAKFLGTEDVILYGSAFDANGGLFETLFGAEDAIISDELNHASIIDGIRLCKSKRYRFRHNDLEDLRHQLREADAAGVRHKIVFTDGVFSMDGTIAQLGKIRNICDEYGALLGVDDSHATGFMGKSGKGTHEHCGVFGKIDIITGTLGKALGGASGGFTAGKSDVVSMLRQRSRPYLFSNSLSPVITSGSIRALDILERDSSLRDALEENTSYFRERIVELGFTIKPGTHPIVPIMLYEAEVAQLMAANLLYLGVYVTGFFYPVVPKGQARIRTQISAQHTRAQLDAALKAFEIVGKELKVIA